MSDASHDPRPFIESARWKLSTTTEHKPDWKHWYTVESWYADDPEGFAAFVALIENEGYLARFEKVTYRYCRVDEFVYWTSRSIYSPGQNLNRRPWADVEGRPEHEQGKLPV
jgi:hypothetical protein